MAVLDITRQPLINNGALAERMLGDIERRDAMRGGLSNLGGTTPDYPYYAGGGARSYNAMGSLVASCVCDLDATLTGSYPGSGQTWYNLEPTPADSAAQSDYDFWLGETSSATTDDPTFTGSADSASAYFSLDGGDHFTIKTMANCPTFLKSHRTDAAGTWCAIAYQGATLTTTSILYGASNDANDMGSMAFLVNEAGSAFGVRIYNCNGTAASNSLMYTGASDDTAIHILICSWDGTSSTNNKRAWLDTRTKTSVSSTFTTSTTDSDEVWRIGAGSNGGAASLRLPSGTKIYAFSAGNGFIDDADAAAIIDEYNARHSRTYA